MHFAKLLIAIWMIQACISVHFGSNFEWNFFEFRHVLHRYANEDVSLGAWFIGLDVEHIDDRRLCCGTPPGMFLFHTIMENISMDL